MATAYLGLGSNLADPLLQLQHAIATLGQHPYIDLIATSQFYQSAPMGPQDQPQYINAVVQVDTKLSAEALLSACQMLEIAQGRERKNQRWGPRTLDIDLLMYDTLQQQTEYLTLPHYGMLERNFVLLPLADILSEQELLPQGISLAQAISQVGRCGIEVIG